MRFPGLFFVQATQVRPDEEGRSRGREPLIIRQGLRGEEGECQLTDPSSDIRLIPDERLKLAGSGLSAFGMLRAKPDAQFGQAVRQPR
jgi:hypothetical protein